VGTSRCTDSLVLSGMLITRSARRTGSVATRGTAACVSCLACGLFLVSALVSRR